VHDRVKNDALIKDNKNLPKINKNIILFITYRFLRKLIECLIKIQDIFIFLKL